MNGLHSFSDSLLTSFKDFDVKVEVLIWSNLFDIFWGKISHLKTSLRAQLVLRLYRKFNLDLKLVQNTTILLRPATNAVHSN